MGVVLKCFSSLIQRFKLLFSFPSVPIYGCLTGAIKLTVYNDEHKCKVNAAKSSDIKINRSVFWSVYGVVSTFACNVHVSLQGFVAIFQDLEFLL